MHSLRLAPQLSCILPVTVTTKLPGMLLTHLIRLQCSVSKEIHDTPLLAQQQQMFTSLRYTLLMEVNTLMAASDDLDRGVWSPWSFYYTLENSHTLTTSSQDNTFHHSTSNATFTLFYRVAKCRASLSQKSSQIHKIKPYCLRSTMTKHKPSLFTN